MGKKNRRKTKEPRQHGEKRLNKKTGQWETRVKITAANYASMIARTTTPIEDPLKNWEPPRTEECPVCLLPMPLESSDNYYYGCCGKLICHGCIVGAVSVELNENGRRMSNEKVVEAMCNCPFCRQNHYAIPQRERVKKAILQAELGSSIEAMFQLGMHYHYGEDGYAVNISKAVKWYTKASDAGHGKACQVLGKFHQNGGWEGLDVNLERAMAHYERATELGYLPAYRDLADAQVDAGLFETSVLNTRKAVMCELDDTNGVTTGNTKTFFLHGNNYKT